MAAESLGGFLYGYQTKSKILPRQNEVVWVNKRYIPTDLRSNAPVRRTKFLYEQQQCDPPVPTHWKRDVEPSLKTFSRHFEENRWYPSSQASRCEEYSTLRQMLPSTGIPNRVIAPRWGTGLPYSPHFIPTPEKIFPHINSPMTRYVDDMHLTNRLFKLH